MGASIIQQHNLTSCLTFLKSCCIYFYFFTSHAHLECNWYVFKFIDWFSTSTRKCQMSGLTKSSGQHWYEWKYKCHRFAHYLCYKCSLLLLLCDIKTVMSDWKCFWLKGLFLRSSNIASFHKFKIRCLKTVKTCRVFLHYFLVTLMTDSLKFHSCVVSCIRWVTQSADIGLW